MALDGYGKSSQEYSVNAGVSQGSILGTTHFLLYITNLPDDAICNLTIYAGLSMNILCTATNCPCKEVF